MASRVIHQADEHRAGAFLIGLALVVVVAILAIQAMSLRTSETGTVTGPTTTRFEQVPSLHSHGKTGFMCRTGARCLPSKPSH